MLYMDDEEIARAHKTGEYYIPLDNATVESPGMKDFREKRSARKASSPNTANRSPNTANRS